MEGATSSQPHLRLLSNIQQLHNFPPRTVYKNLHPWRLITRCATNSASRMIQPCAVPQQESLRNGSWNEEGGTDRRRVHREEPPAPLWLGEAHLFDFYSESFMIRRMVHVIETGPATTCKRCGGISACRGLHGRARAAVQLHLRYCLRRSLPPALLLPVSYALYRQSALVDLDIFRLLHWLAQRSRVGGITGYGSAATRVDYCPS